MQIHELNTFVGLPGETDFLAIDSGFDTAKIGANNFIFQTDFGQVGQLLRTKGDGGTEWVDQGLPTDEQTAQAIAEWLADHPEATTTVQDGSLTEAKFSNDLKKKAINAYVTPEMYGAVGDGVADDTAALQACIVSGNFVYLKGTYLITSALNFNNIENFKMLGGKIVRPLNATFNTIDGTGCDNIVLSEIEFDGNGNDRGSAYVWRNNVQACIILASQSKNIFIEKCKILNHNYGIFILGADEENAPTTYENTSLNGAIRDCVFYNCHSAIDTYGKGITIDHNFFYDITENAIQIEPNYQMDPDTPNPLNDANYYTSAVNSVIINNTLINIARAGVVIHKNIYGCLIEGNTMIDYQQGISVSNFAVKGIYIKNNSLLYQKPQTVDSDKRPWLYTAAINIRGKSYAINNYLWKPITGIYTTGGNMISGNVIEAPVVSAITMSLDSTFRYVPLLIKGNAILNHIKNTSAWWGATAICCDYTGAAMAIIDNIVQSDVEPLKVESGQKAFVHNLMSSTQQSTAIAASDYKTYSNHS